MIYQAIHPGPDFSDLFLSNSFIVSAERECAHATWTRGFGGEFRLVISLSFHLKERKIRAANSATGMVLESKARKRLAAAMGRVVSILSRQALSPTGSQKNMSQAECRVRKNNMLLCVF